MNKKEYLPWILAAGVVIGFSLVAPAFAQGMPGRPGDNRPMGAWQQDGSPAPAVVGSITAINGTTLTLQAWGRGDRKDATSTTYTVDAANATVYDKGATSTLSSLATGDMIAVRGTMNGTTVTATVIRYGMNGALGRRGMGDASRTAPFTGNGQPIVGGTVASVNGTTFTIVNSGNATYTVNAANATVVDRGTTSTIASIVTGDNVLVQGTVNGTDIAATSVIVQGEPANATATPAHRSGFDPFGFFKSIGGFFKHFFGF